MPENRYFVNELKTINENPAEELIVEPRRCKGRNKAALSFFYSLFKSSQGKNPVPTF